MKEDDGDSYLTRYLHQVELSRNLSKRSNRPNEEPKLAAKSLIRLKLNKHKEDYMEVSLPPSLVVRDVSCEQDRKIKKISNDRTETESLDSAVTLHNRSTNIISSKKTVILTDLNKNKPKKILLKKAWPEASILDDDSKSTLSNSNFTMSDAFSKSTLSSNQIRNRIYKLAKKFQTTSLSGNGSSLLSTKKSKVTESGKTFSMSLDCPDVSSSVKNSLKSKSLSYFKFKNDLAKKDGSGQNVRSFVEDKQKLSKPVEDQVDEMSSDENISFENPFTESQKNSTGNTDGLVQMNRDNTLSIKKRNALKGSFQKFNSSIKKNWSHSNQLKDAHTHEIKISNMSRNNINNTLSSTNDVTSHSILRSSYKDPCKNEETMKNNTNHLLQCFYGNSEESPDENVDATEMIKLQGTNSNFEKRVDANLGNQNVASSFSSMHDCSTVKPSVKTNFTKEIKLKEWYEGISQTERQKEVGSVKTPETFSLKSSFKSTMETLHCSSRQTKTPSESGKTLRPIVQNLLSRENLNQNFLSRDQIPKKELKKRFSILFDLPYKATLVKRETNVGAKLHKERRIRESLHGITKFVTIKPENKARAKPNLPKSRRRNSILEFFQNIPSKKEIGLKPNDRSYEGIKSVKTLHVQPERKLLHNKHEIKSFLHKDQNKETKSVRSPQRNSSLKASPISSPKIFRRERESLTGGRISSSIAKSTTYQINERSPLSKKLEELKKIQRKKNRYQTLPIFSISQELLIQDVESGDGCISNEKTYKKTLPGIIKLQKNVNAKKDDRFEQSKSFNRNAATQNKVSCMEKNWRIPNRQNHCYESFVNQIRSSSKCSTDFPLLRVQTPLLPSVINELEQSDRTVKWKNKLGNLFQVREKDGKYGNITSRKDPSSIRNYVSSPKTYSYNKNKSNQELIKERKKLSNKLWYGFSDSPSEHCTNIRPIAKAKQAKRKYNNNTKENIIIIFSNGSGNEETYQC